MTSRRPRRGTHRIEVTDTTRRQWLLGAASLALGACGAARRAPRASGASGVRPVAVLGAGLAGLVAALDLVQSGRDVVVLEAQSRPGGRILTLRSPFSDAEFVEAGAAHVVGDPDLLAVMASVGIGVVKPRPPRGLATIEYFGRQRSRFEPGQEPPDRHALSEAERSLDFVGRLTKYFGLVKGTDAALPWPPPSLARYDALTGAELLTELGASSGYAESFAGAFVGERMADVSGAFVLREMANFFRDVDLTGGGRIEGGSDKLPLALAHRLGDRVVYGAEVKRIEQDDAEARVAFVHKGQLCQMAADRVVCAIPYTVLRHLEVSPAFSERKARAIRELPAVSVARVYAQFGRRFWAERGDAGDAETDLRMGAVRDETKFQLGSAGILGAYLSGDRAREFTGLTETQRLSAFLDDAEKVHPGAREGFVAGVTKCWDEDPFARGAYAWFKPGQMTELGPALAVAEGRVHFAGDHTSHRPGFMHGAVASARRVVREILTAGRGT
jgi:monoamine oxidase